MKPGISQGKTVGFLKKEAHTKKKGIGRFVFCPLNFKSPLIFFCAMWYNIRSEIAARAFQCIGSRPIWQPEGACATCSPQVWYHDGEPSFRSRNWRGDGRTLGVRSIFSLASML